MPVDGLTGPAGISIPQDAERSPVVSLNVSGDVRYLQRIRAAGHSPSHQKKPRAAVSSCDFKTRESRDRSHVSGPIRKDRGPRAIDGGNHAQTIHRVGDRWGFRAWPRHSCIGAAKGEFDNLCTEVLALHKEIKTDCSVNTEYKGKTYCFGNEQAKKEFMKDSAGNKRRLSTVSTTRAKPSRKPDLTFPRGPAGS